MKAYVPIALAFALIVAGCAPPVEPPMKKPPLVPNPPLPKVAPEANPVPGPKPGQDHNPAFKGSKKTWVVRAADETAGSLGDKNPRQADQVAALAAT